MFLFAFHFFFFLSLHVLSLKDASISLGNVKFEFFCCYCLETSSSTC